MASREARIKARSLRLDSIPSLTDSIHGYTVIPFNGSAIDSERRKPLLGTHLCDLQVTESSPSLSALLRWGHDPPVGFLNDVCPSSLCELYGKMMTAPPNDVRFANDVCLTAHWANIASLRHEVAQHHFERSEKHHIAAGDASFEDIPGYALIY